MIYIEAPNGPTRASWSLPSVFLAGGITDCVNWQEDVVGRLAHLDIALFNPRRAAFPMHDPAASEEQITWEFNALRDADLILYWFAGGPSVQPIALYELGFFAYLDKPIVVGCDREYLRRRDVEIQMKLARPHLRVRDSLDDVCNDAERIISREL